MKLIGSRMEQQMRAELVSSNLALREGRNGRLVSILEAAGVNVARAYVLNWIPEQAEDIYAVLASDSEVVTIEVPRGNGLVVLAREDVRKYEGRCSKVQRLKIAIARSLMVT